MTNGTTSKPARIWFATIPAANYEPSLPDGVVYTRGQREIGEGGFEHFQSVFYLERPQRISWLKKLHATAHWEICRSTAAEAYVWKESTRVANTQV